MIGLQLYGYDVADEGVENVMEGASLLGATVLLPAVTLPGAHEKLGKGGGELVHNPKRQHHEVDGAACFRPDGSLYPAGLVPPQSQFADADTETALAELRAAADQAGVAVVPWIIMLNMDRVSDQAPESSAVNARGETVHGWLCPSRPEVVAFAKALVLDVIERFRPPAIFIDRFRFPEWGSRGLVDACACFCEQCQGAAEAEGVSLAPARAKLSHVIDLFEQDPRAAGEAVNRVFSSGFQALHAIASDQPVLEWLRFRQRVIERLVSGIRDAAASKGVDLWLDVWPPSYAWLLGQDFAMIGKYAKWVKPFTYHRLGGGADIAGYIRSFSNEESIQQELYSAFQRFFSFPGPMTFAEFAERGLDASFVTKETEFAAKLLGGQAKLAAGLQLWKVGPDGVQEALEHAWMARPDGVMFYSYGFATWDELAAAGDWLRNAKPRAV